MDWDAAKVVVDVAEFLLVGAVGLYAHINTRGRVTEDAMRKEVARVDGVLKEQSAEIATVRENQRVAPTHNDIEELGRRLGELHGDIQKVDGRLEGIGRSVDLINQHLLSSK